MFVYNEKFRNQDQISVRAILQNYSTVQEARNDLLMLYVYYSDISYTYIYESPFWTIISLLSNFGGQLGKLLIDCLLTIILFLFKTNLNFKDCLSE